MKYRSCHLSLRHLERHRQYDTRGFDILDDCIEQCRKHVARIDHLTGKVAQKLDKATLAGRLYAVAGEKDFEKLLVELDRARAALHLAVELYHQEGQNRRWLLQQTEATQHQDQLSALQQALQTHDDGVMQKFELVLRQTHSPGVASRHLSSDDRNSHEISSSLTKTSASFASRGSNNDRGGMAHRIQLKLPTWFCS